MFKNMIQTTDINALLKVQRINIKDLARFLYQEGFKSESRFSTEDMRIYVSEDSKYMIVLRGRLGKVYSTANQKKALHMFSVIKN